MTRDQFGKHCEILGLSPAVTDHMWAELLAYGCAEEMDDIAIVIALIVTIQCLEKWEAAQLN